MGILVGNRYIFRYKLNLYRNLYRLPTYTTTPNVFSCKKSMSKPPVVREKTKKVILGAIPTTGGDTLTVYPFFIRGVNYNNVDRTTKIWNLRRWYARLILFGRSCALGKRSWAPEFRFHKILRPGLLADCRTWFFSMSQNLFQFSW